MQIWIRTYGPVKDAMPRGKKGKVAVYATTLREALSYLQQHPEFQAYHQEHNVEIWIGKTLKSARNLRPEELADPRWNLPPGTTLHITPHLTGHAISTAALLAAAKSVAISMAVSIAVTLAMSFLFPPPTADTTKERKSVLYEGGLNTQKEGAVLSYVAGLDVLCGSNIIEGDVEYTRGGQGRVIDGFEESGPLKDALSNSLRIPTQGVIGPGGDVTPSGVYSPGFNDLFEANRIAADKGGGKTIRNSIFTDAYLRILAAYGDGPVGGIVGNSKQEKERNIYVNQLPLRDLGTNQLTYQGVVWEERLGEVGQAPVAITPKIANNIDANTDLPQRTSGGSQFYLEKMVSSSEVSRVKLRIRFNRLLLTDKKGNQKATGVSGGVDIKRLTDATWVPAGRWSYTGKSSEGFVVESFVNAPPPKGDEPWMFRIYRTTPDSTDDKLSNDTSFNGHVEYQDVEFRYDGTEGSASGVPTALLGFGIDLSQFDQGGSLPELAFRAAGRKVRVPSNYDPVTRVYTGVWDGSWKTAATQNPVWHWLHLATTKIVGLGLQDSYFNKFKFYDIARHNDEMVNGRPRYTLNKQFTDEQDGWPFLVELASSFRCFPYWNGNEVILIQDRDQPAPDHYINNTMVDGGFFNYQTRPVTDRLNEVLVEWDDPSDYFRKKVERYRDQASIDQNNANGIANGGIISETYYKVGCTNRREAYDFGRLLVYISQNETEEVSFTTMLNAAAYQPGQLIAVDDFTLSGKTAHGRAIGVDNNRLVLNQPFLQKANTAYNAYLVINNQLVIRPIAQVSQDITHQFVACDTTGYFEGIPCGVVEASGVQPRWYRITDIQDSGAGLYDVKALFYAPGKFAWVEQDIPPPNVDYSDLDFRRAIPAPTNVVISHTWEQDDLQGAIHHLNLAWDQDPTPGLQIAGYYVEYRGPEGIWKPLYEGNQTYAQLRYAAPGEYLFTIKSLNTFGKSSDAAIAAFNLQYAVSDETVLPPTFNGFR
ncbi:phage tail protein [Erythrobacter sp. R86502]|uniref:TipJ family phage tail tip protein n=1 Tax=Erythrobacter sp. R86502 TaxID=3093846 RepID=UPI0036D2A448